MTQAQERLAALAKWFDASSANYQSPCSKARQPSRNFFGQPIPHAVEMVVVGRWAEVIPWDFATAPTTDFDPHALPLFVSFEQAEGLNLPEVADLSPPSGQGRAFDRLSHLIGKIEDARLALPAPWRAEDGWLDRLCVIVGLDDPLEPLADAVARVGADATDLDAFPLLCAPLWAMTDKERANIGRKLPMLQ